MECLSDPFAPFQGWSGGFYLRSKAHGWTNSALSYACHQAYSLGCLFNPKAENACTCVLCTSTVSRREDDAAVAIMFLAHQMDYKMAGRADLNCQCPVCQYHVPLPIHNQTLFPFIGPSCSSADLKGGLADEFLPSTSNGKVTNKKLSPSSLLRVKKAGGKTSGASRNGASACQLCPAVSRAKLYLVYAVHKLDSWLLNCGLSLCACAICCTPQGQRIYDIIQIPICMAHNFKIFFQQLDLELCKCSTCSQCSDNFTSSASHNSLDSHFAMANQKNAASNDINNIANHHHYHHHQMLLDNHHHHTDVHLLPHPSTTEVPLTYLYGVVNETMAGGHSPVKAEHLDAHLNELLNSDNIERWYQQESTNLPETSRQNGGGVVKAKRKNKFHPATACPICGKWFEPGQSLRRHISKAHNGAVLELLHEPTTSLASSPGSNSKGSTRRYPGSDRWNQPARCAQCGVYFTYMKNLQRHLDKVHLKDKVVLVKAELMD